LQKAPLKRLNNSPLTNRTVRLIRVHRTQAAGLHALDAFR
jgi:hypothetical protein